MYSNAKNLLTCYLTGDLLICKHHCGVPDKESSSQFTYRVCMLHTLFLFHCCGESPRSSRATSSTIRLLESSCHERWQTIVVKVLQNGPWTILDGLWLCCCHMRGWASFVGIVQRYEHNCLAVPVPNVTSKQVAH